MKDILVKASLLLRPAFFALPLAVIFSAANVQAQPAVKPVPPVGPLLDSAPDPSQWVITLTYPQDRVKGGVAGFTETRTRTITTTKTGNIMHEEVVDARGGKQDTWHVGRDVYEKLTGAPTWIQPPAGTLFPTSGFRDLDWISSDNYVGSIKYSGRNCLVFVQGAPSSLNVESPSFEIEQLDPFNVVAFIDSESRLPVEARAFGVFSSFHFTDAPTDKLTLPPDLVAQLKRDRDILSRLGGRLPPVSDH
jgi:hypothetical protein